MKKYVHCSHIKEFRGYTYFFDQNIVFACTLSTNAILVKECWLKEYEIKDDSILYIFNEKYGSTKTYNELVELVKEINHLRKELIYLENDIKLVKERIILF